MTDCPAHCTVSRKVFVGAFLLPLCFILKLETEETRAKKKKLTYCSGVSESRAEIRERQNRTSSNSIEVFTT